ncbi:MAG TPA: response regulator [Bryobacterales bacterium]|nr:response regulator [Bryobacterales bacterium]
MGGADRQPIVLLVDDEEMVVVSIKSFLMLDADYDVVTANSPAEALALLEQRTVDLVISDYLMPDMDGISFLLQVRAVQPHAIRILLTGYADKENAIKAINEVGLYQYIEKPWDNAELALVIKNGLEKRFLIEKLQQKIREVEMAEDSLREIQDQIVRAFM